MSNKILSRYYTTSDFLSAMFSNKSLLFFISTFRRSKSTLTSSERCSYGLMQILMLSVYLKLDFIMMYLFQTLQLTDMILFIPRLLHNWGGWGLVCILRMNCLEYSIIKNLTKCHKDISESIFVELKHPKKGML